MQLPDLLILLMIVWASIRQQLQGSTPPANDLNSIHRPTGSLTILDTTLTLLYTTPKLCFTCSSVTHVGREGATDNGFISLHVIIGRLITHFTVNVLITFLLKEKFQ